MGLIKNLRSVRINSCKENYLYLYGFVLFSRSIEPDNYNGAIEKSEKRSENNDEEDYLHLHGCVFLSGIIESDYHNRAIQKFEYRPDK